MSILSGGYRYRSQRGQLWNEPQKLKPIVEDRKQRQAAEEAARLWRKDLEASRRAVAEAHERERAEQAYYQKRVRQMEEAGAKADAKRREGLAMLEQVSARQRARKGQVS